jgi:YHS domain-containing protein
MKRYNNHFSLLAMAAALLLASCAGNSNPQPKTEPVDEKAREAVQQKMQETKNDAQKIDVANIKFAVDKDPTCEMPLSAGVSDTAVINGKVYGFCAKECKDEYLKSLKAKK